MAFQAWSVAALTVSVFVVALWLASLRLRDSSIVDSFWGVGFVAVAASVAAAAGLAGLAPRAWLLGALVAVWGLRLSHYIFWRNRGRGEDYRYRAWREQAGASVFFVRAMGPSSRSAGSRAIFAAASYASG